MVKPWQNHGKTIVFSGFIGIPPRAGRALVFSSTQPRPERFGGFAGSAYGEPLDSTLCYGQGMLKSAAPTLAIL